MNTFKYCLLLFIFYEQVNSQDCREYSQTCNDDKACCGGCCMNGICRDTYADCRVHSDPCLEELCPPDQECYVYYPLDCPGCGPTKECRDVPPPPDLPEVSSSPVSVKIVNKSSITSLSKHMFSVIFLILYNV